jgi:predicted Zn-dependent protease
MPQVAGLMLAGALLALPAPARPQAEPEGVRVERSRALSLASAESVERESARQFAALKREAAEKRALAPADHPQQRRLQRIADQLIEFAPRFNERAREWKWEVILVGSRQVNAFCMPGGKIAFFTGILDTLKLDDEEVAMVMGHEIAHALLEHGRERVGKGRAAQALTFGASVASQMMGFGDLGGYLAQGAAKLTLLKFGREDESEADLVGMDLAARAGYDPRAAIRLWQKMAQASGGAANGQPARAGASAPDWLSTHPSHDRRIDDIRAGLPKVMPLYERARGAQR